MEIIDEDLFKFTTLPPCTLPRYPAEFKKNVVLFAEKFNNRKAERMFGIAESNIRRWRKHKSTLFSDGFILDDTQDSSKLNRCGEKRNSCEETDTKDFNMPQKYENNSDDDEEVCLRWNSHHHNMKNMFPMLLQKEQYVDVTLTTEGKFVKCHKIILSSCSTYFDKLFSNVPLNQHTVVFLNSIPFWLLKLIVDFMYTGEVHIEQSKLHDLINVAEILQIKGLTGNSKSNNKPKEEEKVNKTEVSDENKDQSESSKNRFASPKGDSKEDKAPIIIREATKQQLQQVKLQLNQGSNQSSTQNQSNQSSIQNQSNQSLIQNQLSSIQGQSNSSNQSNQGSIQNQGSVQNQGTKSPQYQTIQLKSGQIIKQSQLNLPQLIQPQTQPVKIKVIKFRHSDLMPTLKPIFADDSDSNVGVKKEIKKESVKQKPIKKRKSIELESPQILYRKGTKSRPRVKVPRYYRNDYEDFNKFKTLGFLENDEIDDKKSTKIKEENPDDDDDKKIGDDEQNSEDDEKVQHKNGKSKTSESKNGEKVESENDKNSKNKNEDNEDLKRENKNNKIHENKNVENKNEEDKNENVKNENEENKNEEKENKSGENKSDDKTSDSECLIEQIKMEPLDIEIEETEWFLLSE